MGQCDKVLNERGKLLQARRMQISCSGCGKQLPIEEQHRGRKIQCGECKALVYVPSFTPEPSRWAEAPKESNDLLMPESIPENATPRWQDSRSMPQPINRSFPAQPRTGPPPISDNAIITAAVSCLIGLILVIGAIMLLTSLMNAPPAPAVELVEAEIEPTVDPTLFPEGYAIVLPDGFQQESREESAKGDIVYRFRTEEGYRFTFAIIPDKSINRFMRPPQDYSKALVKSVSELSDDDDVDVQPRRVYVDRMSANVFNYWVKETYRGVTFTYHMVAMDSGRKLVLRFAGKYGGYDWQEENITLPEHWYDSLLTFRHLLDSELPDETPSPPPAITDQ